MCLMILLVSLLGLDGEWIPLDELTITRFLFSAQNESRVAFTYHSNGSFKLAVYDFEKGKAKIVKDGRFTPLVAFPVAYHDGFMVINTVGGTAFRIEGDGSFGDKIHWDQFTGWEPGFRLAYLAGLPEPDKAVITINEQGSNKYLLAMMDLNQKSVEIIFNKQQNDESMQIYWLKNQQGWIEIEPQSGRIDLLQAQNFKVLNRLSPAQDPWKLKHKQRGSIYAKRLDQPTLVGKNIYIKRMQYEDLPKNASDDTLLSSLVLSANIVKRAERFIIGSYHGKELAYSWTTGELSVSP